LEFGFEDKRARTVAPAHAEHRMLRRNQPPSILGRPEQGGKARRRIETGPAQPIDRTVAADQGSRFAVADERIVFNSKGHAFRSHMQRWRFVMKAEIVWRNAAGP